MAELRIEPPAELEFWRSESWVDIWAGVPLQEPLPGSAAGLVRNALLPGSNVNFPQITEICERIATEPPEIAEAIRLLVEALRDGYVPFTKKLKALTISNELMYEERAVLTFRAIEGLHEVLATLRSARDTGLGAPIDENIRMLATEIDKICFSGGAVPQARPGQLSKLGSALKTNFEAAAKLGSALKTNTEVRQPSPPAIPKPINGVLSSTKLAPPVRTPSPLPTQGNVKPPVPPQESTAPPLPLSPPPTQVNIQPPVPPQEIAAAAQPPLPAQGNVIPPALPPATTALPLSQPPLPTQGNVKPSVPSLEIAAPPLPTQGSVVPPMQPREAAAPAVPTQGSVMPSGPPQEIGAPQIESSNDPFQSNSIAQNGPRSESEPPGVSPDVGQPDVGLPSELLAEFTTPAREMVGTTVFSDMAFPSATAALFEDEGVTLEKHIGSLPMPCEQPPTSLPSNTAALFEDDPTNATVTAIQGLEAPSLDVPVPLSSSSAPVIGDSFHSSSFPATSGSVGAAPPLAFPEPKLHVAAPVTEFPTPPTFESSKILAGEPIPTDPSAKPVNFAATAPSLELPAFSLNLPPPPKFTLAVPSSGVTAVKERSSQLLETPAMSLDLPAPPQFVLPTPPPLGTANINKSLPQFDTSGPDPLGPSMDSAALFGASTTIETIVPAPAPTFGAPPSNVEPPGTQAPTEIAAAFGLPPVQTPLGVQPPETQTSSDIAAAFGLHAAQELSSSQPPETQNSPDVAAAFGLQVAHEPASVQATGMQTATDIAAAFDLPAVSTDVITAFGLPSAQSSSNVKPLETQTATDVAAAFGFATVQIPGLDASPSISPPQTGFTGPVAPTPLPQAPPAPVAAASRGVDSLFD